MFAGDGKVTKMATATINMIVKILRTSTLRKTFDLIVCAAQFLEEKLYGN